MNTNGQSRPADEDEAVPLLNPDDCNPSSPQSNGSRIPFWLQHLLFVYHVARTTAPQLININVLWVFAPLGLTSGALHWNSILTSIFNFLAIVPLSAAVSDASDKLSDAFGDLLGAFINATFGNAVELIVYYPSSTSLPAADHNFYRSAFWLSSMEIHPSPSL